MKTHFNWISIAICTVLVHMSGTVLAAAFLKLGDIKGESTEAGKEGWILIESVSFGVNSVDAPTPVPGTSALPPQTLIVSKWGDKASPKLMEASATGERIPLVRFEFAISEPQPQIHQVLIENVLVTSFQLATPSSIADERLKEIVHLEFDTIKFTYTEFDESGSPDRDISYYRDFVRHTDELDDLPAGSFRMAGTAGTASDGEPFIIRWSGFEEFNYLILGSPNVGGPYEFILRHEPSTDGAQVVELPVSSQGMFFRIEKVPGE